MKIDFLWLYKDYIGVKGSKLQKTVQTYPCIEHVYRRVCTHTPRSSRSQILLATCSGLIGLGTVRKIPAETLQCRPVRGPKKPYPKAIPRTKKALQWRAQVRPELWQQSPTPIVHASFWVMLVPKKAECSHNPIP